MKLNYNFNMLSIIIPTLNEEDYLPMLLKSIKKQDFKDYEIIVADAGSKDKTLEIAKKYGCVTTRGGAPARGRNAGAKIAKGEIMFFLDADTVLPDDFLKKSLEEFNLRKLDFASFCFDSPSKENAFHFMLDFYNKMVVMLEKITPYSIIGVLIKKDFFDKTKGYDETLKLSEDRDFGARAAEHGKFGIIRSAQVFISDRRFKKDGWATTTIKYLLSELYTFFIGPVRSDIFNYKFNHYKDN